MLKGKAYTREEFIDKYGSYIQRKIQGTGLFFETVIGQAVLESSGKVNGQWLVGGSKLSREAHNLFGIKANKGWKGIKYNINTNEYSKSGDKYTENADFRAYRSYKDSIDDYVKFLKENKTYSKNKVFDSKNYYEQAQRLKQSGYATAPYYADSIKGIVSPLYKKIQDAKASYKRKKVIQYTAIGLLIISSVYFYINLNKKK